MTEHHHADSGGSSSTTKRSAGRAVASHHTAMGPIAGRLYVNSCHHQGVRRLADGLRPMCRSLDGLVEGFFHPTFDPPNGSFVVGIQFHPERLGDEHRGNKRVYEDFIWACAERKRKRAGMR
eukprot:GHVU01084876.1.p1 GENE.GHVU01084876.1~~GHVU01084876.1.p1  ORF type:complete len:122 (+),score=7.44 GHVU01084876.1:430-795(+)